MTVDAETNRPTPSPDMWRSLPGDARPEWSVALVFTAIFAVYGVSAPYFPVWLASRGLSSTEIALVIGAPLVVRFAMAHIVGWLADGRSDRRALLAALAGIALIAALILPGLRSFWPVLLVSTLMMMAFHQTVPLSDATVVSLVRRGAVRNYGRLRAWGSASFAVVAVAAGIVLNQTGIDAVFGLFAGLVALVACAAYLLPSASLEKRRTPQPFGLLDRKAFLIVLVSLALIGSSQAMFFGFGSVHMLRLGYPDWSIGVLWTIGVIAEVVVLWLAPTVLIRFGAFRLSLIAAGTTLVRWLGMGLDPPLWGAAVLQLLHAGTLSCFLIAQMAFMEQLIEDEAGARANNAIAVASGLLTAVMLAITGPLYEALGGKAYFIAAALPAAAIVLLVAGRAQLTAPPRN